MSQHGPPSEESQFKDFLNQLINAKYLEGAALGITKLVIDKGREALSGKQEYVFQKDVIDRFVHERCKTCHDTIPWCEMFFAIDRGQCVGCDQRLKSSE
jgi:hypothetical protein